MAGTITLTGNSNTLQPVASPKYVATVEGVVSETPAPVTPFVVQWADIVGKPPFGTAASRDVPAVGDAATNQVVLGTDTRLTNTRGTTVAQITDATNTGRDLLTAPGAPQARAVLGSTGVGDALFTAVDALSGRNTLGLGTISTLNAPLPIANGGTAATTVAAARTNLGATVIGANIFTAADVAAVLALLSVPAQPTFRNKLLNAAHNVNQFNNSVTALVGYIVDNWRKITADGTTTAAMVAASGLDGFPNFLRLTSGAANTANAGSYWVLSGHVEGINILEWEWGTARAKTAVLSFWVRPSITGTYAVSITNNGATRSYVTTFTGTAAVWEKKTIIIPGDTTGTWDNVNLLGVETRFCAGIGTTYGTSTLNAWQAGNLVGATTQTNIMATNGATFDIAGIQLEVGAVATPFEYRAYQAELNMLQRYYEVGSGRMDISNATAGGQAIQSIAFKALKRVTPAIGYGVVTITNAGTADFLVADNSVVWQRLIATANGGCVWQGTFTADSRF